MIDASDCIAQSQVLLQDHKLFMASDNDVDFIWADWEKRCAALANGSSRGDDATRVPMTQSTGAAGDSGLQDAHAGEASSQGATLCKFALVFLFVAARSASARQIRCS
jgi:hypothetical protein